MPAAAELAPIVAQSKQESTLAEQVYESLLEAILTGKLKQGDVVSVVKLSAQLGVSRTPVHEAIRALVNDGLVIQETNRRPVIAQFTGADVNDIYSMRLLLESEAAARAASRIDRPTIQRLRSEAEDLGRSEKTPEWLRRWADHDSDLHESLAAACGSKLLAQDIRRYRRLHHGFNALCTDANDLGQAVDEHLQLLDALEQRDGDAARNAMNQHLREWQAYFSQRIDRK